MSNSLFHVSERNHIGLIFMSELAREYNKTNTFISLATIAKRMHVSSGYLEEIAFALKREKIIEGKTGRGGGYRLSQEPSRIPMEQILMALEGPIAGTKCMNNSIPCALIHQCKSRSLWNDLSRLIVQKLKQTTLADIAK